MEKNKKPLINDNEINRTMLIIALLISFVFMLYLASYLHQAKEQKSIDEDCIVYGSIEHQARYAFDKPLADKLLKHGGKLGPYFNYKFCD